MTQQHEPCTIATEKFLEFANHFPEPLLLVSPGGTILAANQSVRRRLGLAPKDLAGRLLVAQPTDYLSEYLCCCSRSREMVPGSLVVTGIDGSTIACRSEGQAFIPCPDGSPASVLLRLTPEESTDVIACSPASAEMRLDERPKARVNLLLVDDSPANLLALEAVLEDLGHNLVKAASGHEALRLLLDQDFAVVLLDVRMPGLDGFETAKLIRSQERSRHLPILFLTAYDENRLSVEAAYALGAVDYLVKPLVPVILRSKVAGFVELFEKTEQIKRQAEQLRLMERRRFEQTLAEENARKQESEERLRAIIDNSPSIIFVKDREGRYLLANRACEGYSGEFPEGMIGKTDADYLPREYADRFRADDLRVLQTGQVVQYEEAAPIHHEVRTFLTVKFPLRDARGQPHAVCGIATDITELKRATEALRESEERFRTLADNISQLAWMADEKGWIFWYNRRWYEYTGTTLEQMEGWGWKKVHHPDHVKRVVERIQHSWDTGERWEDTFPLRGVDGSYRWFLSRAVPIRDGEGRIFRWFGTNTDITEQRELEQALREADRRKDDFLATLAHELRNPLAPLRNGLQVMKMASGNTEAVEQARGMMERQLGQMVHLIDDLLDVSRITRGKLQLRRERVDLASAIHSAVEGSRPLIEASAHDLTITLPPKPVLLDADPTRLAQVFTNLLTNAAKYTEKAGHIWLTAEQDGGEVVVSVRDTGIGIAAEHLPRLFEMFSQVAPALDRSQGGLGIGLSLVRGLLQMHGGSIEVRSEGLGKGSEFIVRLPVEGRTARDTQQPVGGEKTTARPRRRILVADDNRDAAESLAMMLRLAGHEVHATHDGQEAVEAAAWFRPDVALLDIGMPKLNGFEATRRIRQEPWGKNMILVATTGWGQEEDKRRAMGAGFDHHLTKPVDPAALEKVLAGLKTI